MIFSELFNLEKKRTIVEAIIFYVIYLIISFSIIAILAMLGTIINNMEDFNAEYIGYIVAIIFPLVISTMIIKVKKLINIKYILLLLLSGVFGVYGLFFGLLPTTLLTLQKSNKNEETNNLP